MILTLFLISGSVDNTESICSHMLVIHLAKASVLQQHQRLPMDSDSTYLVVDNTIPLGIFICPRYGH